jgi:hypothetical protein
MTDSNEQPLVPNYVPGVGRLATDRYDFQDHITGTGFRHQANQIDLSPLITIDSTTTTNVQQALQLLAANLLPPSINQATIGNGTSNLGIITLGGDLSGSTSTALSPRVSGLQGRPVSSVVPSTGEVLTWNGTTWSPVSLGLTTVNMFGDVTGLSNNSMVSKLQGTVNLSGPAAAGQVLTAGGSSSATWVTPSTTLTGDVTGSGASSSITTTVSKLQGVVLSGSPTAGQILTATSSTAATWSTPAVSFLARVWADNSSTISPTTTGVITSVAFTPVITGKIRVIVTGNAINNTGSTASCSIGIVHGVSDTITSPIDYYVSSTLNLAGSYSGNVACVVDYDKLSSPIIFTPFTTVFFNVVLTNTTANAIGFTAHSCQIEIQEVY